MGEIAEIKALYGEHRKDYYIEKVAKLLPLRFKPGSERCVVYPHDENSPFLLLLSASVNADSLKQYGYKVEPYNAYNDGGFLGWHSVGYSPEVHRAFRYCEHINWYGYVLVPCPRWSLPVTSYIVPVITDIIDRFGADYYGTWEGISSFLELPSYAHEAISGHFVGTAKSFKFYSIEEDSNFHDSKYMKVRERLAELLEYVLSHPMETEQNVRIMGAYYGSAVLAGLVSLKRAGKAKLLSGCSFHPIKDMLILDIPGLDRYKKLVDCILGVGAKSRRRILKLCDEGEYEQALVEMALDG